MRVEVGAGERLSCEYSLIRYVPDPVKGEFVNIGVLLRETASPERMELRFTRDWTRVRCIHPDADIAALEALEIEVRQRVKDSSGLLKLLEDTLSNIVQVAEPKACLAETFLTQLDQLMRLFVEAYKVPREKRRTGRTAILGEMRKQFEREGVWDLMAKRIAASRYTKAGDPLQIDCGYRTNGTLKMFQAVSLEGDIDGAIRLAFSRKSIFEQVEKLDQAQLLLTAIVEPIRELDPTEKWAQYEFGRDTMEANQIRVMTTNELAGIAATARTDLRIGL